MLMKDDSCQGKGGGGVRGSEKQYIDIFLVLLNRHNLQIFLKYRYVYSYFNLYCNLAALIPFAWPILMIVSEVCPQT